MRCRGRTESRIRDNVSLCGAGRNASRIEGLVGRVLLVLATFPVLLTSAVADWIRWESGFRADSGQAVISVDGNPATDGVANLYHFHRVNFEAAVDWRDGDTLQTNPEQPSQWIYTVGEDSDKPLKITIRLSHVLGYETIQLVDEPGAAILCRVFMGDLPAMEALAESAPASLAYQIQLFRSGKELSYTDDPDGVDYSDAPGMTFNSTPVVPLLSGSAQAPHIVTETSARAAPMNEITTSSHLSVATFGIGAPSWDEIVLTFSDNTGSGIIRAGTRMRVLLSGVPMARSSHAIPCTSDPIPPLVYHDTDRPLHFDVTGIVSPTGSGTVRFHDPESGELLESLSDTIAIRPSVRASFSLRTGRGVPAGNFVNVVLESDGFFNNQPTMILVADGYQVTPLDQLMKNAWARQPDPWPSQKPIGRPLWESSMSLCDKLDPSDTIALQSRDGQFHARHLNARRIVFGSIELEANRPVPALWRQRSDSPTTLSESRGRAECANNQLAFRVGGHTIPASGITTPAVWVESEKRWIEALLPVPAFCIGGNVLGINDNGVACGFVEIKVSPTPNRLPCAWVPAQSGGYGNLAVLPTPEEAVSGGAVAINRKGIIVGYTQDRSGRRRACRWNPTDTGWAWEDLGVEGVAVSINWLGTIVGGSPGKLHLWQCEERFDLNALVERSDEQLEKVFAVGELGDVVGGSVGKGTRILLQPKTVMEF